MAASDLIPDLQDAVAGFQTTVAGKQTTIDAKKSSGETAAANAQGSKDAAVAHKDTAQRALDAAYADTRSVLSDTGLQDISALSDTITATAVDVFVYDTSKDSDGGAWRYRTTNTSWYNEPLNTTTRGSRREFPAVAVIVSGSNTITIYDGDDPTLPMWMAFQTGSQVVSGETRYKFLVTGSINAFTAKNGWLSIARNSAVVVDFIGDRAQYMSQAQSGDYSGHTVAQRNEFGSINTVTNWLSETSFGANKYYDVAMTVLPSAPIDTYTGLPVPTIAFSTNDNVKFVRDDGTVFEVNYGSYDEADLALNEDWTLMMVGRYLDRSFKTYIGGNEFVNEVKGGNNTQRIGSVDIEAGTGAALGEDKANATTTTSVKWIFGQGFSRLHVNTADISDSMVCSTSSSYSSGWLVGDIKGAFLSDTDDTNITGSLFNSNSSFNTDVTGVTPFSGATISHDTGGDGGRLKVTSDGSQYCGVFIDYSTAIESGKTYFFQIDYAVGTYTGNVNLSANGQNTSPTPNFSTSGTYTAYLTSTYSGTASRQMRIRFQDAHTAGEYFFVDNVIIKEVELDRSYKDNGLTVNGTITRSAVATGAELVSYGGFGANNYLQQEYNSDLDFGTGDFCMMVWAKDQGLYDTFLARSDNVNQATEFIWQTGGTTDSYRVFFGNNQIQANNLGFSTEGWHLHTLIRRSGTVYFYHNGELQFTSTSGAPSLTQSGAVLQVGIAKDVVRTIGVDSFEGEMTLLRITSSVPTEAQLKKIYNDEKHLFKENANCTLYGTSDDVNALAYDEDTGLLHVGTSGGRSVFKGLQRVDNTTDAVGVAISASNDLVVEE
jgi:trimeric autotransporter adhesin